MRWDSAWGGTDPTTGYCYVDSVIAVMDALTGEPIQTIPAGDLSVLSVSFSPDGKKLLATMKNMSLDFVMAVYDLETGERERAYFDGKAEDWSYVTAVFSLDGETILYNYKGEDDMLEIRRASDWELLGSKLGVFSYEDVVFGDDPNIAYDRRGDESPASARESPSDSPRQRRVGFNRLA